MKFPEVVFHIKDDREFQKTAIEIFRYQARNNKVYNLYLKALGKDLRKIRTIREIPFLPVEFFRTHKVIVENADVELVFESSTTSGSVPSRHFISDLEVYKKSFNGAFRLFYGAPEDYIIVALLPSYTERVNSSLVYMVDSLIKAGGHTGSGFYSNNEEKLMDVLDSAKSDNHKIILIGVSFALFDLAEKYSADLSGIIVMETGGMKGRRKEITRTELHEILKRSFRLSSVHSEYGMTELLSQAYSAGGGIFSSPPWMKVLIRDPNDPLTIIKEPFTPGGINIIDLANFNSCSFIATGDLGRLYPDNRFEVLGRFDNSDIRGCNLLFY